MTRSPHLNVMVAAVRKAARGVRRDFGEVENLQVSLKGPANFVTRSDRQCEKVLHEELARARPDYGFLMEEAGAMAGRDRDRRWIIDPIDGTTNFIHGIPHFAICVALEHAGRIIASVVYNPISDELFTAERGRGAFVNNRRLRVSARSRLEDAVIVCGIPHRGRGDGARFRAELETIQATVSGIRRLGAASLDFAWLAAGRFDGFWERGLAPWDIAAGMLLVSEAGGRVEDLDGGKDVLASGNVIAAGEAMFSHLHKALSTAGKEK